MKDQIQFETNGLTVLAVKVPTGKHSHYDSHGYYVSNNNLLFKIGGSRHDYSRTLPEGNWRIHAITTDMTEEQADELVKEMIGYYALTFKSKDYLFSKLRSHGIDPNEEYVLLIKEI